MNEWGPIHEAPLVHLLSVPRLMIRRFLLPLLPCLLALLSTQAAAAPPTEQRSLFHPLDGANRFLPVHEAFKFTATETPDSVLVRIESAPGYYLYKSKLSFAVSGENIVAGEPVLPAGEDKSDPYFGDVVIYHGTVDVRLPVQNRGNETFTVHIGFQGCAEKGLCYPPDGQTMVIGRGAGAAAATPWSLFHLVLALAAGLALITSPYVIALVPIFCAVSTLGRIGGRRGVVIAIAFILPMAASYALLGASIAQFGSSLNLQGNIQSTWVLVPLTLLFLCVAVITAGGVAPRLTTEVRRRVSELYVQSPVCRAVTAACLGLLTTIAIAPSIYGPGAKFLTYISATGDIVGGGLQLFALCLGMCMSPLVLCLLGTKFLSQKGEWAKAFSLLTAVGLAGVAIWLLDRIVPSPVTLGLWGLLAVAAGVSLVANRASNPGRTILMRGSSIMLVIYGVMAWCGMLKGEGDPARPLGYANFPTSAPPSRWLVVNTPGQLAYALAEAKTAGRPALVDWTAKWCVSCKTTALESFAAPDVKRLLRDFHLIRVDVTAGSASDRKLLELNGLLGPAAIQVIQTNGTELASQRLVGDVDEQRLLWVIRGARSVH